MSATLNAPGTTSTSTKLSIVEESRLLLDIFTIDLPLSDITFAAIVDLNPICYPQHKRRKYQVRFQGLKRLTVSSLQRLFDTHQLGDIGQQYLIKHGYFTMAENVSFHSTTKSPARDEEENTSVLSETEVSEEGVVIEPASEDSEDDDATVEDVTTAFATMKVNPSQLFPEGRAGSTKSTRSPVPTPGAIPFVSPAARHTPMTGSRSRSSSKKSCKGVAANTRSATLKNTHKDQQSSIPKNMAEYNNGFTAGYAAAIEWISNQDGTKVNPFWIYVNPSYPERNIAGLVIQKVEKFKQDSYERKGYHIRSISDPKWLDWQMLMPDKKNKSIPRQYRKRLLIHKRPSTSAFFEDNEWYHRGLDCQATKDAHETSLTEVEDDENRQWLYFYILFPEGTVFNNLLLQKDESSLPTKPIGVQAKHGDETVYGISVYWRVAEEGGRKIRNERTDFTIANMMAA